MSAVVAAATALVVLAGAWMRPVPTRRRGAAHRVARRRLHRRRSAIELGRRRTHPWRRGLRRLRRRDAAAPLADYLAAVATELRAGGTVTAAFLAITPDHPGAGALHGVCEQVVAGVPLGDALALAAPAAARRRGQFDLDVAVHALSCAAAVGGSAAVAIDAAASVLRERAAVAADARAHSAQARLSARVLTIVPVGVRRVVRGDRRPHPEDLPVHLGRGIVRRRRPDAEPRRLVVDAPDRRCRGWPVSSVTVLAPSAAAALVVLAALAAWSAVRRTPIARRRPTVRPGPQWRRRVAAAGAGCAVLLLAGPLPTTLVLTGAVVVGWWRVRRGRLRRVQDIRTTYPDAIDLVVLAIRAGLLPAAALETAGSHVAGVLRPAFAEVGARTHQGERFADALVALVEHLGEAARPMVDSLAAAERYGLPIAPVLERLADEARADRRRAADAAARQLPVRLAAPLVLCTLPSFVLLAIVPLLVGAFSSWHGP